MKRRGFCATVAGVVGAAALPQVTGDVTCRMSAVDGEMVRVWKASLRDLQKHIDRIVAEWETYKKSKYRKVPSIESSIDPKLRRPHR